MYSILKWLSWVQYLCTRQTELAIAIFIPYALVVNSKDTAFSMNYGTLCHYKIWKSIF